MLKPQTVGACCVCPHKRSVLPALQHSPARSPAQDAGAALSLSRRSTACLARPSLPAALAARPLHSSAICQDFWYEMGSLVLNAAGI